MSKTYPLRRKADNYPDPSLFKLMAESVQDYAIFLLDVDGRVISWNAGAREIKGYADDEIIGRHFSIFYTAEDLARNWPAHELQRARVDGRLEDEGWRVRKDGSRFWANVVITALMDDDGQLVAYSKITRDISIRKQHEESLRESEERFRLLVEGVQDYAIYMLDPNGIVTSWNAGASRIKGYDSAEIIGKHFSVFFTQEDIRKNVPADELAITLDHGRFEGEGWRLRKDKTRFCAKVIISPMFDSTGGLRGFAKITQDLTKVHHAQTLEDSARNIHEFIAVLAHELRNPLAPIRNAVHVLKLNDEPDPVKASIFKVIDRQSEQLTRIVDDLLDISRISRGIIGISRQRIPIQPVIERAVEAARPALDAAGHTLEIDCADTALFIEGDEVRIAQVLTNILNNAGRYTEPGGHIWLKAGIENEDGRPDVVISIRDNGRGIQPSLLNAIFGMFVQGHDQINRAGTGLGVGLALARSIVELHHGTLEARSPGPGKGSEFIIRLPEAQHSEATEPSSPAADEDGEQRRRILVADDNKDSATVVAALLEQLGHYVVCAHDGHEALAAFNKEPFDILLLDVGMPGMDGLELARRIRAQQLESRPLIAAITGWGNKDDERRSKEAGFDVHLVKPVEEVQLRQLLTSQPDRSDDAVPPMAEN